MRIRAYLILMAVAVLLPVIIFSAVALRMLQASERDVALQSVHETAYGISLLVDRELYSAEAALRVLAQSETLVQGDFATFYTQAKAADRPPDGWTLLLAQDGQQLINTGVPFGTKLPFTSAKERVEKVLDTQRTYVSDVFRGALSKRMVTTVDVPVPLADGKRYTISTTFDTGHFNNLIASAHVPEGWLVGIIDSEGHFIARSVKGDDFIGKSARPELVEAARKARDGQLRHTTLEGTESYDVFTHSSLSNWTIAVAAPVELIERSSRHAVMVAGSGMFAAVLCALGLASLFGNRHVHAIKTAAKAAVELGMGKPPVNVTSAVVEVNELHAALQTAGKQLELASEYRKHAEDERQALLAREQTARQMAEEQNRAKDEFLAMLGHELRNPLAPISTAAQLLTLPGLDEKRIQYTSEVISRQVEHMNNLVGDLLDVSRVTRGLVTLNMEPVDIQSVVSGAVEQVHALIDSKGHRLHIHVPQDPVYVIGDKTRLVQVFANLLNNAAKYTDPDGAIDLEVGGDQAWVELTVADNGHGLASDFLPRIFDLFSQGKRKSDRAQGGLGLGLALVRSLVELHSGSVAAYSDGEGKGSKFVVRLPRWTQSNPQPATDARKSGAGHQPFKILIVDDNVDAAQSLALFLREARTDSVTVCHDGMSALAVAVREAPEVLILDIGLPDMDGYELARRIRRLPQTAGSIIVALTGYGQANDKNRAVAAGFDHHFSKPAMPIQILEVIADTVRKQKE